ncbi:MULTISPECIES: hypothetical protein [Actinomadura]|uniref:Uncharacterized protein n=1 Tax=Actinomadura yumaensis TaxID=111807 RepID=A0ABW2CC59_9ACTN|nr:hypothetical protein [Actinomadura sp. J1-007]MWK38400.1 hypothetical protein [Actinomadura sp. J1-007]
MTGIDPAATARAALRRLREQATALPSDGGPCVRTLPGRADAAVRVVAGALEVVPALAAAVRRERDLECS